MRLTVFSDFALRALIYLESHEEPVSLRQIAAAYGVSHSHLVKVVALLQKAGFVTTRRGPGGGVTLARPANQINLADVLRATEPDFNIVECLDMGTNSCPIAGLCKLTQVLCAAKDAFLAEVGRHTLADVTQNRLQIGRVLAARAAAAPAPVP
jgi:Rrf2 family nitric oxide-sensitive transcriptional repressor